jgi:hypothetical protein
MARQKPNAKEGSSKGQAAIESNQSTARLLHAQAAIETLVMVGFAIAFIIPLALLFISTTGSETAKTSIAQAKASARLIAVEAGEIYLQGNGSRKTIAVNYPDGVINGSAADGLVVLRVYTDGRQLDITSMTFANISGDLSGRRTQGVHRVNLVNIDGKYVNITYG